MFDAYRPSQLRRECPAAARLASLFVVLAAVGVSTMLVSGGYTRFVAPHISLAPILVGSAVHYLAGHGLIAAGAIRHWRLDVGVGLPDRGDVPVTLAAVLLPVALIGGIGLLGNAIGDATISTLTKSRYATTVGWAYLLRVAGAPAALNALGVGLLLFGVVQERLRETVAPDHAIVLTVFVAGVFELLPFVFSRVPDPPLVVVFALAVAISIVAGVAVGVVYHAALRTGTASPVTVLDELRDSGQLPIAIAGGLATLLILSGLAEFPDIIMRPMWMLVVGTGAIAYERTRSLWPAMLTVFVYKFGLSLAVYAETFSRGGVL